MTEALALLVSVIPYLESGYTLAQDCGATDPVTVTAMLSGPFFIRWNRCQRSRRHRGMTMDQFIRRDYWENKP